MKPSNRIIIILVAIAGIALWWFFFFPQEEAPQTHEATTQHNGPAIPVQKEIFAYSIFLK